MQYTSHSRNVFVLTAENANITDPEKIEKNLALAEHVRKGAFQILQSSLNAGIYFLPR
jgi:hypothetical protein